MIKFGQELPIDSIFVGKTKQGSEVLNDNGITGCIITLGSRNRWCIGDDIIAIYHGQVER